MSKSPDLGIPLLAQSQANPDITHNEALLLFQALSNGVVNLTTSAPPGSPTEGDSYVIAAAPTGAWAGRANSIAIYWGGAWRFVPDRNAAGVIIIMGARQEGMRVFNRADDRLYIWNGAAWSNAVDVLPYVKKSGDIMTGVLSFTSASAFNLVLMETQFDGVGPFFQMYHNDPSPAAMDFLAGFVASGNSSTGVKRTMGEFYFRMDDVTNGAERSHLRFAIISAGALTTQMYLRNGVVVGSDFDISQGRGTLISTGAWFVFTGGSPIQVVTVNALLRKRVFTVAALPASHIANGDSAIVTNATATTLGSIVAGGGANRVPVNYDGTNWRIG